MNKEEIKKLIDKEIKEKENILTFYNMVFIAFSIFFAALIQIIVYYYTNSKYLIPTFGKLIIFFGIMFPMIAILFLIHTIFDRLKLQKGRYIQNFLLIISLVIVIFLIGMFILNQGPKANISYRIFCPHILENWANISLYVENKGTTNPSFIFFSTSTTNLQFVDTYSDFINESSPSERTIFSFDKSTLLYPIFLKDKENSTNITLLNHFKCPKSVENDCILTPIEGNENDCFYARRNNKYEKQPKIIRVVT